MQYRRLTQDERLAAHAAALGDDPDAAREGRAALLEDVDALIKMLVARWPPPRGVEIEDYLQEIRIEVLTCIPAWKPERGEWTTYAGWRVQARRSRMVSYLKRDKRGCGVCFTPLVDDPAAPEPAEDATEPAEITRLAEALDALPERDREVLRLRFGLVDCDGSKLAVIGERYGISKERVRQIEAKALDTLRQAFGLPTKRPVAKPCTDCGGAVPNGGSRIGALAGTPLCFACYRERKARYIASQAKAAATNRPPGVYQTEHGSWEVRLGGRHVGTYRTIEAALAARERFLTTGGREAV